MKITRRKLAFALAGAPALTGSGAAQTPAGEDAELKAARDRIRRTAEALASEQVPIETEPAFQFKA